MPPSSLTVLSLRIWCDVAQADWSPASVGAASFRVCEFAELSDGREVVLMDDRGWSTSTHSRYTVDDVEHGVYNVLLPDWADVDNPLPPDAAEVEGTGGAQDWELLCDRLRGFGVTVTSDQLSTVPRRLDLSPEVRALVRDPSS